MTGCPYPRWFVIIMMLVTEWKWYTVGGLILLTIIIDNI